MYIVYVRVCIVRFPVLLISWNGWRASEIEGAKKTIMMNSLTKTSMHIHWRRALFLSEFIVSFTISIDGYFVSLLYPFIHSHSKYCHSIYFTDTLTIKVRRLMRRRREKLAFYFLYQKCPVVHFECWNSTAKCFIAFLSLSLSKSSFRFGFYGTIQNDRIEFRLHYLLVTEWNLTFLINTCYYRFFISSCWIEYTLYRKKEQKRKTAKTKFRSILLTTNDHGDSLSTNWNGWNGLLKSETNMK